MFTRRLLAALSVLAAAFFVTLGPAQAKDQASDSPDPKIIAEVTRYLGAIHFGETFLGGVSKANSAQGQGSPFLDRLLAAPPQEIEATVAPAFATHVTLKEARAMADFFASPLGQKALKKPTPKLTSAETSALEKFGATSAGELGVTLPTDSAVRQQYFALLKARYDP